MERTLFVGPTQDSNPSQFEKKVSDGKGD